MIRQPVRYSAAILVIVLLAGGGLYFARKHALQDFQVFIENHYRAELSLIEREMQAGQEFESRDNNLEGFEIRERVRIRISDALAAPDFFAASWSNDGHHGLESLKPIPTGGYSYSRMIGSTDAEHQHSLYFGQADDGTRLLVYVGWVQSPWKREYRIAFRQAEIEAKMQDKQRPDD